MPWYCYFALKQLFPSGKRISFFALVSIFGVTLGVMVLLIVQSVMNGLGSSIRNKLATLHGDIQIRSTNGLLPVESTLKAAQSVSGITCATPLAQGLVFFQYQQQPFFPTLVGVDPNTFPVGKVLSADDAQRFQPLNTILRRNSILISQPLANRLGCKKGDLVTVFSPFLLKNLTQDEVILPQELIIEGIFEAPFEDVYANAVLCDLSLFQNLYELGPNAHAIRIQVDANYSIEEASAALNQRLQEPLKAYTWLELNQDLLFILKLEKSTLFLIILFIILVASFSISASLLLSVVRRTREIGLLRAIGAKTCEIASCFCFQGALIGVLGLIFGLLGGGVVLHFRDPIVMTFAKWTSSTHAFEMYYRLSQIPSETTLFDLACIIVFTLLITILAGMIPAWRAAKLQPSEALRNE